jgi:hypothetical protein
MFRLGTAAGSGRMIPLGNFSFSKRTLVGWLSELNPEGLGSLWLMASATRGGHFG